MDGQKPRGTPKIYWRVFFAARLQSAPDWRLFSWPSPGFSDFGGLGAVFTFAFAFAFSLGTGLSLGMNGLAKEAPAKSIA